MLDRHFLSNRKTVGSNGFRSMLRRIRTREYKGWIHEGLEWDPSHDEFQRMLSQKGEVVLHCRGRDIYRLTLNLDDIPVKCFLHMFRNTSLTRALKKPYAWQVLLMSNRLRKLGFPSIEVLAAIRPKNEILNWNSMLIAREILNVRELPASGKHVYRVHARVPFSAEVAEQTASELARFHDSGLFHGDLKSRHVLVSEISENKGPEVFFVDLEKTRNPKFIPPFLRDILAARDLIQLLTSLPGGEEAAEGNEEKSILLTRYLEHRKLGSRRSQRIRRAVRLYLDSASLRQGETLLKGLKRKMTGEVIRKIKKTRY